MKAVTKLPQFEAVGGAYEGASRTAREIALWQPASLSADLELGNDKTMIDARSRDLMRNDGYILGAINTHQDSIVGSQFLLAAKPDLKILSKQNPAFDEAWLQDFTQHVESMFTLWGESPEAFVDASRINTFTSLIRLGVGLSVYSGEILASVEWIARTGNPYRTAIKMIDADRLSNPQNIMDTASLSKGVEKDRYGAPVAYHIRHAHPSEWGNGQAFTWKRIAARKPWGRRQIIHIFEQNRVDQTRNVGNIVSSLKEMKMTKRFQDVVLQNAVMNATFAATIESELPPEATYAQLGTGESDYAQQYMQQVAAYSGGANNIKIDNARIPHLWPGQKLRIQNPQSPGGMGEAFEQSLLRHVAASLGLSYEQFAKDYTKTNFASARASMGEAYKHMQSRKKLFADRFATLIYQLWFEEALNRGDVPMPVGITRDFFYEGQNKDALTQSSWLGASRGQIDPLKETQAAVLRLNSGLSTLEIEVGNLGLDYRDVIAQRKRENDLQIKSGVVFNTEITRPNPKTENEDEDE